MKLALTLLVAVLSVGAAHAREVYRWTDGKGVVHYSDRPASGVAATLVELPDGGATPEEIAAAQAALAADRQRLERPLAQSSGRLSPKPPARKPADSSCAASWRRYDAAQACFDAHRAGHGKGVTVQGETACQEMQQPDCPR